MSKEGKRAAAGAAALLERLGRDQHRGHERGGEQVDAHDEGGHGEQAPGVADAGPQALFPGRAVGLDQRHHADARLEPTQPEDQQREGERGCLQDPDGIPAGGDQPVLPAVQEPGIAKHLQEADDHHDRVEQQVDGNQRDRDADSLAEPGQEDGPEHGQEHERDRHVLVGEGLGHERVLDDVGGCVG